MHLARRLIVILGSVINMPLNHNYKFSKNIIFFVAFILFISIINTQILWIKRCGSGAMDFNDRSICIVHIYISVYCCLIDTYMFFT